MMEPHMISTIMYQRRPRRMGICANLQLYPHERRDTSCSRFKSRYQRVIPLNSVGKRHDRILSAVFEKRAGIAWSDIEGMLKSLGAEISEGSGSRVRIALNGVRAVFHRPHPQRETDRGAVASMRRFLVEAGIEPEGEE